MTKPERSNAATLDLRGTGVSPVALNISEFGQSIHRHGRDARAPLGVSGGIGPRPMGFRHDSRLQCHRRAAYCHVATVSRPSIQLNHVFAGTIHRTGSRRLPPRCQRRAAAGTHRPAADATIDVAHGRGRPRYRGMRSTIPASMYWPPPALRAWMAMTFLSGLKALSDSAEIGVSV